MFTSFYVFCFAIVLETLFGLVLSFSHNGIFRSSWPTSVVVSPPLIDSVTSGTILALEHCQSIFHWDRWNCPRDDFARHSNLPANREVAFTKAIISAGIVYSITRNCSRGEIKECGCNIKVGDPTPSFKYHDNIIKTAANFENASLITGNILLDKNRTFNEINWSWGGCSDDTSFAIRIAREILEGLEKTGSSPNAYVGRHNYRVGREIVRQSMIKKCRCHGVSGSCSLQTCWTQVAPFQNVANKLREKYNRAARLTKDTVEKSLSLGNSIKRDEKEKHLPAPENMLVYLEQSPDYCVKNSTENRLGTKGRTCSKSISELATLSERRSCRILCRQCGHKVKKARQTIKKRCNCNFQWCCSVKCDVCYETVEEFYCH